MWTPTTRQQHSRTVTRYQTDLTDAEWRVIAPHLPKPCAKGLAARLADARDR
jgi:transposase